jgi:hypothetical protein
MSRSYTSFSPCVSRGVLWDSLTFYCIMQTEWGRSLRLTKSENTLQGEKIRRVTIGKRYIANRSRNACFVTLCNNVTMTDKRIFIVFGRSAAVTFSFRLWQRCYRYSVFIGLRSFFGFTCV